MKKNSAEAGLSLKIIPQDNENNKDNTSNKDNKQNIKAYIFMGCKHCGKSTQGKSFAKKIDAVFYDIDEEIEKNTGKNPRLLYREDGKEAFKKAEYDVCLNLVDISGTSEDKDNNKDKIVISTGGGICDNEKAITALKEIKKHLFVYLSLDIEYSINRIMNKITEKEPGIFEGVPAYVADSNGNYPNTIQGIKEKLTEILKERCAKYEKLADITIDIKNAPIEDNFHTILGALRQ